ncbi:glycosyltransferase [Psychromonas sp. KJ10-10]|uniref:glycosyltransferase n=1 Tax=Psychromonas sp. KJ10-10 TaxID=3391823 RepID=UPI0039B3A06C
MSHLFLISLTIISGLLVIYHHLGYPLILRWFDKKNPQNATPNATRKYQQSPSDQQLPKVAVVVPAYNEAQWIAEKIRNLASLDYPAQRLQVVIACDGCSDNTYNIACATANEPECQDLEITIHNFIENRGKVAVLNEQIAQLNCDLVALSDTSALLSIDALLLATFRFKDPKVGVLNGHYQLQTAGSEGEQAYWHYQSKIKRSEATTELYTWRSRSLLCISSPLIYTSSQRYD